MAHEAECVHRPENSVTGSKGMYSGTRVNKEGAFA